MRLYSSTEVCGNFKLICTVISTLQGTGGNLPEVFMLLFQILCLVLLGSSSLWLQCQRLCFLDWNSAGADGRKTINDLRVLRGLPEGSPKVPSWDHPCSSTGVHYNTRGKDKSLISHNSFAVLDMVSLYMFVWMHVYRYVWTCMCLHAEARGGWQMPFLIMSIALFETEDFRDIESQLDWLASEHQESTCSFILALGLQATPLFLTLLFCLRRSRWPWTHRDLPSSASQVLGLKACATMLKLVSGFLHGCWRWDSTHHAYLAGTFLTEPSLKPQDTLLKHDFPVYSLLSSSQCAPILLCLCGQGHMLMLWCRSSFLV